MRSSGVVILMLVEEANTTLHLPASALERCRCIAALEAVGAGSIICGQQSARIERLGRLRQRQLIGRPGTHNLAFIIQLEKRLIWGGGAAARHPSPRSP